MTQVASHCVAGMLLAGGQLCSQEVCEKREHLQEFGGLRTVCDDVRLISLLRTQGLAHVRLVQHKGDWPDNVPLPKIPGLAEDATVK